jgi:IS30 family transposase
MANKKNHLSDKERFCIEKMCLTGDSFGKIARTLGRGLSTISEEVNENGGRMAYSAERAVRRAYWKQYGKKRNCNKVAMDGHLTRFVEKKLVAGWSPGAISSRLERQSGLQYASEKSIRKFIGNRSGLERFLFWNRNDHKGGSKRKNGLYLSGLGRKFIETRPSEALYQYGHWEVDFIVSQQSPSALLVCIEKYSKLLRLATVRSRDNNLVNKMTAELLRGYSVKTITTDNDIGFGKWRRLEQSLGASIYFCHPYHSWEKGLVENANRWIREFIPKKTDLQSVPPKFLNDIEMYFNHRARECLNGRTAYEVMMEKECGKLVESLEVNFPVFRIRG